MIRAKRQNIAGRKILCFPVEKAALQEFSWLFPGVGKRSDQWMFCTTVIKSSFTVKNLLSGNVLSFSCPHLDSSIFKWPIFTQADKIGTGKYKIFI